MIHEFVESCKVYLLSTKIFYHRIKERWGDKKYGPHYRPVGWNRKKNRL